MYVVQKSVNHFVSNVCTAQCAHQWLPF